MAEEQVTTPLVSEEVTQESTTAIAKESPKDAQTTTTTSPSAPAEPRKTFIGIAKSSPYYVDLSKIFHWRDPVKSGLLFGILNFFFLLITWGDYTVLTLISYLELALLAVCFGFVNYVVLKARFIDGKKVDNPFKAKFKNSTFHISRSSIVQHVDTVLDIINLSIDLCRDVFYCINPIFSLQAAGVLYGLAILGKWFNGLTLIYLVLMGFFIWPRLYEEKQQEIDHFYAIGLTEAQKYIELGLSKLPPAVASKLNALKQKSA